MRFVNKNKDRKVRMGKRFSYTWVTVRKGETIDLPASKGKRYGFEEVTVPGTVKGTVKVTEGKAGSKKVETKQIEKKKDKEFLDNYTPDGLFFKELTKVKGIGKKTATDIVEWGTKEKLIEAIKEREHLPFRDDVEKKLRKKYG